MLSGEKIKTKIGKVVSDGMEKSVVVKVEYLVSHPLYKKRIKKTSKFMAHDEKDICNIGDSQNCWNSTFKQKKKMESYGNIRKSEIRKFRLNSE